jgi:hypothetical protein
VIETAEDAKADHEAVNEDAEEVEVVTEVIVMRRRRVVNPVALNGIILFVINIYSPIYKNKNS